MTTRSIRRDKKTAGIPHEAEAAVTTSSGVILAADVTWRYLHLVNDGDFDAYIRLGAGDAEMNKGTRLNKQGGSAVFDQYVPIGAVKAIAGGATTILITVDQETAV